MSFFIGKKHSLNFSCFLLLFVNINIAAQFDFKGKILDAETSEPLSFANVFVSNTMIGVNSNKDGSFLLENVPKGNQEIVFSFIGYETLVRKMNANEYSAKRPIEVKLKRLSVSLSEIEVKAVGKKKRKRYLKKFTKAFLGNTVNAVNSKIINPEVIDFQQDGKKVVATAQDLIEVENKNTGYRIKFFLEKFEMEGSQIIYGGKPLFQELETTNNKEKKKWEKNRWATYQGSQRHFFETLVNGNLKKEGFKIFLAKQKNTRTFQEIRALKTKHILEDSNHPKFKNIKIEEFLKVVFTKKKEKEKRREVGNSLSGLGQPAEKDLIEQTKRDVGRTSDFPTSYLFARKSKMKISLDGRLEEPQYMLTYGSWGEEGVADLLPFNYLPNSENKDPILSDSTTLELKGFQLSKLLIPFDEIQNGGPPRDGIPSIDYPKFVAADEATFLKDNEKILGVSFNGIAKAYPIKILNLHEIVNDDFGGKPIAVTFCPLCASGVGVDALIDGEKKTFGVSGLLYNSDVLLYDRETESLWSQIMGQAVSGKLSGTTLNLIATEFTSWGAWKQRFPNSQVLSTETGFLYDYEKEAYVPYFETQKLMFSVSAQSKKLKNKDKVIGIEINGQFKAYPLKKLKKKKSPFRDEFNGEALSIFYDKKSKTARIEDSNGKVLPAITMFWFAWYAFHEETELF